MLLDLELDGEVGPHPQYRPDVYCRKFSSDLYWYEAVMRRGPEDRIADLPGGWEIIKEMRLFFMPRHYFDVQSFVDPLPGLVDLRDIAVSYCQRIAALIDEKWFFWRQRRAWRSGEVVRGIAEARQILFICYGNINRSALADVLVRDYAQDCGFTVVSAGLHQEEGRPADPVMVDVARARGVELGHSQSTMVTPELLASSDLIFVMEKRHADALLVIDPSLRRRIYLLGAHDLLSRVRPEIADPYGRSRESYETCFEQISRAVDQVKSVLVFRCGEL
jgi:protein-tyrosine-phosphatase